MNRWHGIFAGGRGVTLLLVGRSPEGCEVVAVRFRRRLWTQESAAAFLEDHGLRHAAVHVSRSSLTFEQTAAPLSRTVEYGAPFNDDQGSLT